MRSLAIERVASLPVRAWVALVERQKVAIAHGSEVRTFPSGVYEGGWALTDSPEGCEPVGIYAGAGLFQQGGRLLAIAPTQTCDVVFVVTRRDDAKAVSNSLALALTALGIEAYDPAQARTKYFDIISGLDRYSRTIFDGEFRVQRFTTCTVDIDTGEERRHEPTYHFAAFAGYKAFLLDVIRTVKATSEAPRMVTYLSRGYDSPACAALMKELGGGEALTQRWSRQSANDDGTMIADRLGLKVSVLEPVLREMREEAPDRIRTVFTRADIDDAYEFCPNGTMLDLPFKAPDHLVAGSLVLTGLHGDKVWDLHAPPTTTIKRGDSSGGGIYEFRLRTGFTHLAVPFAGAIRHPEIHAISNSEEMRPWSVGGTYDRPIPRRIAEEAGVPRKAFGQKKAAVGMLQQTGADFHEYFFARLLSTYRSALSARAWDARSRRVVG